MQVCQSVRSAASFDDEDFDRIRKRVEKRRQNAIKAIGDLKLFLMSEPQPRTRKEFERFAIKLEVVHEAVNEAAGEMR